MSEHENRTYKDQRTLILVNNFLNRQLVKSDTEEKDWQTYISETDTVHRKSWNGTRKRNHFNLVDPTKWRITTQVSTRTGYCPVNSMPKHSHIQKMVLINENIFEIFLENIFISCSSASDGYTDIGDGCGRQNVLATALWRWWRFLAFCHQNSLSLKIIAGHQHFKHLCH